MQLLLLLAACKNQEINYTVQDENALEGTLATLPDLPTDIVNPNAFTDAGIDFDEGYENAAEAFGIRTGYLYNDLAVPEDQQALYPESSTFEDALLAVEAIYIVRDGGQIYVGLFDEAISQDVILRGGVTAAVDLSLTFESELFSEDGTLEREHIKISIGDSQDEEQESLTFTQYTGDGSMNFTFSNAYSQAMFFGGDDSDQYDLYPVGDPTQAAYSDMMNFIDSLLASGMGYTSEETGREYLLLTR